jgi:hypothetical protein
MEPAAVHQSGLYSTHRCMPQKEEGHYSHANAGEQGSIPHDGETVRAPTGRCTLAVKRKAQRLLLEAKQAFRIVVHALSARVNRCGQRG